MFIYQSSILPLAYGKIRELSRSERVPPIFSLLVSSLISLHCTSLKLSPVSANPGRVSGRHPHATRLHHLNSICSKTSFEEFVQDGIVDGLLPGFSQRERSFYLLFPFAWPNHVLGRQGPAYSVLRLHSWLH